MGLNPYGWQNDAPHRQEDGVPIGAGSSLHFLVGPSIAFAVLALLALFMRWTFGTGYGRQRPRETPPDELLTRVATLSRRESALPPRAGPSPAGTPSPR